MIGPTGAVAAMVATRPVNFRKDAEGLAVRVRWTKEADAFPAAVYVLRVNQRSAAIALRYAAATQRWRGLREEVTHADANFVSLNVRNLGRNAV